MEKELKSAIRFLDKVYLKNELFEDNAKKTLEQLQSNKDYSSKDTVVLTRDLISDIVKAEMEWIDKEMKEWCLKKRSIFHEFKIQPEIIDGTWKIIQKRYNRKNIQEVPLTVKFIRKVLADEQEAGFKIFLQEEFEKAPVSVSERHNSKAKKLVELSRYDEALKEYNRALKSCLPDDFLCLISIHLGIMEVFKKTDRNQEALREVSRAASILEKLVKKAEPEFKYDVVHLKVGKTIYGPETIFEAAKKAYTEGEQLIPVVLEPPETTKKAEQSFMKKLASVIFTMKEWECKYARLKNDYF